MAEARPVGLRHTLGLLQRRQTLHNKPYCHNFEYLPNMKEFSTENLTSRERSSPGYQWGTPRSPPAPATSTGRHWKPPQEFAGSRWPWVYRVRRAGRTTTEQPRY